MKKVVLMLLAVMLIFSVTACGGNDDVRGDIAPAVSEPAVEETPTVEGTPVADEEEDAFSKGTSENNVYENEFLGMGCSLDSSWTFQTDEQIEEMNKSAAAQSGLDYETYYDNASVIYDMHAVNENATDNMIVSFENLGVLYGAVIDEQAYLDATIETVGTAYANMGFEVISTEIADGTIAGETHKTLAIELNTNGTPYYQKVYVVQQGKYMCVLTFSAATEEALDAMAASFYAL